MPALQEKLAVSLVSFVANELRAGHLEEVQAKQLVALLLAALQEARSVPHFVRLICRYERAYPRVARLELRLSSGQADVQHEGVELQVERYAASILADDPTQASEILAFASRSDTTLEQLRQKYAGFAAYLEVQTTLVDHRED